jgi:large subunit ribosomal protein L1
MARGKKYTEALGKLDRDKSYSIEEAIGLLKSFPERKFDQTIELSLHLGIDGRQADQILRGTVMLPNGTGKDLRVLVITQGELVQEAEQAGADFVGGAELVSKIEGGWLDFDLVVASPDMMGQIGSCLGATRTNAQS